MIEYRDEVADEFTRVVRAHVMGLFALAVSKHIDLDHLERVSQRIDVTELGPLTRPLREPVDEQHGRARPVHRIIDAITP